MVKVKSKSVVVQNSFELETPRDHHGFFNPQTIAVRKISISNYIGKKIIGLYGLGMSYSDIQKYINEMHDFEVSVDVISYIKDQILPEIKEW